MVELRPDDRSGVPPQCRAPNRVAATVGTIRRSAQLVVAGGVLLLFPLLFFRVGADSFLFVGADPTGTDRFGFCCGILLVVGVSLTSEVCHFEFPPGILEGLLPGIEM